MAELIHPALRVRIARRRYVESGKKSLRNFDWERGIWVPPQPRTSRFGSRPFVARAVVAFGTTILLGMILTNFEGISRGASDLSTKLTTQFAGAGAACRTGGFRL